MSHTLTITDDSLVSLPVTLHKLEEKLEINFLELPKVSQLRVIAYGMQRYVNDALGGKELQGAELRERLNERLDMLRTGDVGQRQSRIVDPILNGIMRVVSSRLRAKGVQRKSNPDAFDAKCMQMAREIMESTNPQCVALVDNVKAQIQLARETTDLSIDDILG